LESNVNSRSGDSPDEQMIRLKRYIHSIRQNLKSRLPRTKVDRDSGMAEMVMFLAQQGKDKIIVSGDNSHITKSVGKMGSYLLQASNMDYLPIGFTVGEGTYSAYGPSNPYRIHSPYIGTWEYLFSKMGMSAFTLDTRLKALNSLSTSNFGFRSIGSRPQESTQFAEIKLRSHFDAIVYIQESMHTTFLTE
jgi:erythromycin esterase-like protein